MFALVPAPDPELVEPHLLLTWIRRALARQTLPDEAFPDHTRIHFSE